MQMHTYNFRFGSLYFDVLEHVAKVSDYDTDTQRQVFRCMVYSEDVLDMQHKVLLAYARHLETEADNAEKIKSFVN